MAQPMDRETTTERAVDMNREQLQTYITEIFHARAEHPFAAYPSYAVFRHDGNKKWFAVIMDIPGEKLGLTEVERLDIVNVKCDPIMIASLRGKKGFYPAYHMNKDHWMTVALDSGVEEETIKDLLAISYELTDDRRKK